MPITPDLFPDFLLLNWLPDETLFSLVSRQHLLSGEVIASRTSERFFGGSRAGAQHDFPNRLATFVERTGGRLGGLQEVGLHRTLLNFYSAFITSQECAHAIECMAGDSVAHLKLRLGILTSRFRAHHPLKACPVCMEEDASSTGWAYWHLQHQYPGVWVCTKHAQPLLSSALKATGVQRFQWILPRQHELCDERTASQGDDLSGRLFRLAALVETLVQRGAREPLPMPQLYRMYRYAMLQRGWLTAAGSLRMNVIAKEFLEHIRPLRIVAEFAGLNHAGFRGGYLV
ncbi:TniQ family protein [Pantoea sp. 18069]|uniref:TniQ family protein n=1 Tax=Pantoea sp. 18069 TaxID=2681415 RepID=UPI0013586AFA|nr:TniQ family protein [Pantoea sp. 18069]